MRAVGVGDQFADHQLSELQGALRDGQAMPGLDPGEKGGCQVTGLGNVRAVPDQGSSGLDDRLPHSQDPLARTRPDADQAMIFRGMGHTSALLAPCRAALRARAWVGQDHWHV